MAGSAGNLWIGTQKGLCELDKKTGTFRSYFNIPGDSTGLSDNFINVVYEDKQGLLWIGTANGLNIFDRTTRKVTVFKNNPADANSISCNVIRSIYQDKNDDLWIGTFNGGVNRFDKKTNKFTAFKNNPDNLQSISNNNVYSINEDNENKLLFGTDLGLNVLDRSTMSFISYRYQPYNDQSISRNEILSVYRDNVGRTWVGTWGGGLNLINSKNKIRTFNNKNEQSKGLSNNRIRSILEDKAGNLWVGTDDGLNKYNSKTNTFITYQYNAKEAHSISGNKITPIVEDKSGVLWVGTFDGLNKMVKDGEFISYKNDINDTQSLSFNKVRYIYEDRSGGFWIGTWGGGGGLNLLERETGKFKIYKNDPKNSQSLSNNEIFFIYEDSKSRFWVGTWGGGLDLFDRNTGNFFAYRNNPKDSLSLSSDYARCIYEDSKGRIWVGTHFGIDLLVFKNEKAFAPEIEFVSFTQKDGLPNDCIYGILEDSEGNLWMSTNKGICRFTPPKDGEMPKIHNYDVSDGLQSNEYNGNAFFKTKDGKMYFGGINGFNSFYPDSLTDDSFLPPVVITKFQIFNKQVGIFEGKLGVNTELLKIGDSYYLSQAINFTKEITLSYKENMFTFEFSSLDYTRPEKNQYAYKMEGFDSDWNYNGSRRFATYTNLPPGAYDFRVKATNCDGVWNEIGTSIIIIITPPWWQTWWFRIGCIVLIIALIIFYIRWREYKLKKEKIILEENVKLRTAQLQQANEEITAQRDEIEVQRDIVTMQKEHIEQIHKDLTDSIHYAERIQTAVLPSKEFTDSLLSDYFILFKPRDIVSGDFYWMHIRKQFLFIACCDCTGHGVPGAFMSMLGVSFLSEIVAREDISTAGAALDELRNYVIKSLQQSGKNSEQHDGMDISFIALNVETNQLQYAGANNPLYVVRKVSHLQDVKPLEEWKGDNMPIAFYATMEPFTNHELILKKGDSVYLCTDGYEDQFGGPKNRKFMAKQLKKILLNNSNKPMIEQKEILDKTIENWIHGFGEGVEQTDDITMVGIRI